MSSSVLPVALQNKLLGYNRASNVQLLNLDLYAFHPATTTTHIHDSRLITLKSLFF